MYVGGDTETVSISGWSASFAAGRHSALRVSSFTVVLSTFISENKLRSMYTVKLLEHNTHGDCVGQRGYRTFDSVRLFVCLPAAYLKNERFQSVQTWCYVLGIYYKWHGFGIERSNVKVTEAVTLHNDDTSFQITIAIHSHSLGGDTDTSNTAWVRTLWVLSS